MVAESFERIHRSNLVGMGILPLQFADGETFTASLGLTGEETIDIVGLDTLRGGEVPKEITVRAGAVEFSARVRIDTPMEAEYFRHGGILPYVLRQLARRPEPRRSGPGPPARRSEAITRSARRWPSRRDVRRRRGAGVRAG